MTSISTLSFLTEWNSNTLQFSKLNNINTKIPGFGASFFNTDNVSNGILGVSWTAPTATTSATLSAGETLFEVCFKAVGLSGTLTAPDSLLEAPIQLNRTTAVISKRDGVNIGLAPRNCEVQIIQPPGVRIVLSPKSGKPGDEICTDVTVGNFKNVIDLQFSLSWEPADIDFTSIKSLMFFWMMTILRCL
jgi:hypothetical protein